jgi:uncharacterized membrane protein YdjX (TVP38/TMEM64 family)
LEQTSRTRAPVAPSPAWLRLLPLVVLVAGLGAFFALGLQRYVRFEALAHHREMLLAWVGEHRLTAPVVYILVYIVAVALSVPGGIWLTITGGFLFGTIAGGMYTVIGATLGATALFLAARSAVGDLLRARAGSALQRMEEGFRRDAFNYLLVLRLVPLFPFFLVNLVPAFLGVSLRTYVAATALGIIPGVFVFASVGNGLGAVFDAGGEKPHLLTAPVLLPLAGLAVLALIPVVYRAAKRRQDERGKHG